MYLKIAAIIFYFKDAKKAKQEKIENAGKTPVVGKGLGTTLKLSEPQRALLVTIKNGQKQIGNVRKFNFQMLN